MILVDSLLSLCKDFFQNKVKDNRRSNTSSNLSDILQGALSMFHLKDPSLLLFRQNMVERAENLTKLYKVGELPSDSTIRSAIDVVNWTDLHQIFPVLWSFLKEKNDLTTRHVLGGYLAFAADGTGHFASGKLRNKHSMTKTYTKKDGTTYETYYHQTLAAVQITPTESPVFPIAVEPILNSDGATKNDCEQNALKRLLPKIRKAMPDEHLIGIYDALAANGPAVRAFMGEKIKYIITMKEGAVLQQVADLKAAKSPTLHTVSWTTTKTTCTVTYTTGLYLNASNTDIIVNYVEFSEFNTETGAFVYQNAWITDLPLSDEMMSEFVSLARARWKVENETFNTLKNQGYHLEHNYGVGQEYLATNFMLLTFIAFFIDQIALSCDEHFKAALAKVKSFRNLWEKTRQLVDLTIAPSFDAIYRTIAKKNAFVKPMLV
jgi:hypothetical protein